MALSLLSLPPSLLSHILEFAVYGFDKEVVPSPPYLSSYLHQLKDVALVSMTSLQIMRQFAADFKASSLTLGSEESMTAEDIPPMYQLAEENKGAAVRCLTVSLGREQSGYDPKPGALDGSDIDWDRVFGYLPNLKRLDLSKLSLVSRHVPDILVAASKYCRGLEPLILPSRGFIHDNHYGCTNAVRGAPIEKLMTTLYQALERWHGRKTGAGLRQLTVPTGNEVERLRSTTEFLEAVMKFCPQIEFLDDYEKMTVHGDAQCYDMWSITLETWEKFNKTCTNLKSFSWTVVPFADPFFRVFGDHVKPNLTELSLSANRSWNYHRYFRECDGQIVAPPPNDDECDGVSPFRNGKIHSEWSPAPAGRRPHFEKTPLSNKQVKICFHRPGLSLRRSPSSRPTPASSSCIVPPHYLGLSLLGCSFRGEGHHICNNEEYTPASRPGYGLLASEITAVPRACPALTHLSVEIDYLHNNGREQYVNLDLYGDEFWEAVAERCPKLQSIIMWDGSGYANFNIKSEETLTDRTLLLLAEMKSLRSIELAPARLTGQGIFEYLRRICQDKDFAEGERSVEIRMGGHMRTPVAPPRFYAEIVELLKLLAEISEEELGAVNCRQKPTIYIKNPYESQVHRHWCESYMRDMLLPTLDAVKAKHPSLGLGVWIHGRKGNIYSRIDFISLKWCPKSEFDRQLFHEWEEEEAELDTYRDADMYEENSGDEDYDGEDDEDDDDLPEISAQDMLLWREMMSRFINEDNLAQFMDEIFRR